MGCNFIQDFAQQKGIWGTRDGSSVPWQTRWQTVFYGAVNTELPARERLDSPAIFSVRAASS